MLILDYCKIATIFGVVDSATKCNSSFFRAMDAVHFSLKMSPTNVLDKKVNVFVAL
jgi:hypothetical protein